MLYEDSRQSRKSKVQTEEEGKGGQGRASKALREGLIDFSQKACRKAKSVGAFVLDSGDDTELHQPRSDFMRSRSGLGSCDRMVG